MRKERFPAITDEELNKRRQEVIADIKKAIKLRNSATSSVNTKPKEKVRKSGK